MNAHTSEWYYKNRERAAETVRKRRLMRDFGMTVEDYDKLLAKQGGGCAICKVQINVAGKRLAVDHDHQTGVVRGILCDLCNTALGKFRDDPGLLVKAIAYLERYRSGTVD